MAGHPELRREGSGLAGVVRLGGALRHHHVGAHRLGLGHEEFELAGLVAARRQPGAVVALDPDLGPAEFAREPVEPFERRRQMGEEEAGKAGEMHVAWRAGGRRFPAVGQVGVAGLIGGLGLVGAFGGAVYAIQTTTIANAVFLFAASPLITALLAWVFLGERPRAETWATIALALVGIFIMVRQGLSGGAFLGNLAALVSALGFAVFTVTIRWRGVRDTLPFVLVGSVMALTAGGIAAGVAGDPLAVPATDIAGRF
jgi:hypothetical protein